MSVFSEVFLDQEGHCARLGSPFTAQFCRMFAAHLSENTKVGTKLHHWPGDGGPRAAVLPLRLMGALHALVLTGQSPELAAVYPPRHEGLSDADIWAVVRPVLERHAGFILDVLDTPPQTNEVRRMGAILPGFFEIAHTNPGLPFVCSELGASAGLNLNWNQFNYQLGETVWGGADSGVDICPDWRGPSPKPAPIEMRERTGCDLSPFDLSSEAQITSLLSYLWPDQKDRMTRTRAAITLSKTHPYEVEAADVYPWLKRRLSEPHEGAVHVIYHTITWQYFDEDTKAKCKALIEAAGARATSAAPLAWLSFENDGDPNGGLVTLRQWPGSGEIQILARADFHGRWVKTAHQKG